MGILNDKEIKALCLKEPMMIAPCSFTQSGAPSHGLGSFGYDICLGKHFLIPKKGEVLDPIQRDLSAWEQVVEDDVYMLPPNGVVLAESLECFNMPPDVFGLTYGKSSYARSGVFVNVTPLEPMWRGVLTIEIKNLNPFNPVPLYVGEGIAQVVFLQGEEPERNYENKEQRFYQDQAGVTPGGIDNTPERG